MKPIVFTLAAATLVSACSERDMCISSAQGDIGTLERLARETRANIARGYALDEETIQTPSTERCLVTAPNGEKLVSVCPSVQTRTRQVPRAIDLEVEAQKLASMERRLESDRARVREAVAQCVARYPK